MASTTTLTVLCLNGRRQKISISSNTSFLQVLEDVCKKQNLNPDDYDLTHYNKKVDLSLIIRFSGFPNNASFELAPVETRRIENDITVGLQLECGDRLMHDFKPSTNLWDIICHWQKEKGKLKNDNESGEPICIYMRKELVGEETLKNTTLRNLGLTSGKAVIRFMYRKPDTLKEQAHVCVPLPKAPKIEDENIPIDNLDKSNYRITSNQNTNTDNVSKIFPTIGPAHEVSSVTDQVMSEEESNQVMIEEISNQKVTEEKVDDTTETEVTLPLSDIIHIGERNAILFNLEDLSLIPADLPDEFYEVTIEDVKYMFRDLARKRKELEEKPLLTSALRDRQEINLLSYKFSVIRIYFPDRFVLQGIFLPTETIGDIMKFVQKFLNQESMDFYLYLTPPKTILSPDAVLYKEKLVPAAILHFGSNDDSTNYLQDWVREKVSSPDTAKYTAQLSRVKKLKQSELLSS